MDTLNKQQVLKFRQFVDASAEESNSIKDQRGNKSTKESDGNKSIQDSGSSFEESFINDQSMDYYEEDFQKTLKRTHQQSLDGHQCFKEILQLDPNKQKKLQKSIYNLIRKLNCLLQQSGDERDSEESQTSLKRLKKNNQN